MKKKIRKKKGIAILIAITIFVSIFSFAFLLSQVGAEREQTTQTQEKQIEVTSTPINSAYQMPNWVKYVQVATHGISIGFTVLGVYSFIKNIGRIKGTFFATVPAPYVRVPSFKEAKEVFASNLKTAMEKIPSDITPGTEAWNKAWSDAINEAGKKSSEDLAKRIATTTSIASWIFTGISAALALSLSSVIVANTGTARMERDVANLPGSSYCGLCNWDSFTRCSKARCGALGYCHYQETEDQRGGICLPAECEKGYPKITKMKAEFYVDKALAFSKSGSGCPGSKGECAIELKEDEVVPWNATSIFVTFDTNLAAECRYAIDKFQANFSEMEIIPYEVFMPKTRNFSIDISKLERGREHYIFFKCKGPCGEEAIHPPGFDYNYIKFKIADWPDWLPPTISLLDPQDKSAIPETRQYEEIYIYLDKQGSCGYSAKQNNFTTKFLLDKDCNEDPEVMCHFGTNLGGFVINSFCEEDKCRYPLVDKIMFIDKNCTKCVINISLDEAYAEVVDWNQYKDAIDLIKSQCAESQESQSEDCKQEIEFKLNEGEQSAKIPIKEIAQSLDIGMMEGMKNKFFRLRFRCANENGYLMPEEEVVDYTIFTAPGYNITFVKPIEGEEVYGEEMLFVVNTSNIAMCKYSIDEDKPYEAMEYIYQSFGLEHQKVINLKKIGKGQHAIYVKCRNYFNIEEKASVSFKIVNMPRPNIIRFFTRDSRLIIETDVPSICGYSIDNCNFSISDIGKVIEEVKEEIRAEAEAEGQGAEIGEGVGEASKLGEGGEAEQAEAKQIEAKLAFKKISPFKSLDGLNHETYSNEADVYYVKCTDIMQDNEPECVEVRPFSISK